MIIKKYPVRSAGEVAGYHQKPDKNASTSVLFSNVASSNAFWIGREFDAVSALAPRVRNPYAHLVIALHPDDMQIANDRFFFRIGMGLRHVLGLNSAQTILWRHTDTAYPHCHLLISRVTPDGKVVTAWRDMKIMSDFRRHVQHENGLRRATVKEFEKVHAIGFHVVECSAPRVNWSEI